MDDADPVGYPPQLPGGARPGTVTDQHRLHCRAVLAQTITRCTALHAALGIGGVPLGTAQLAQAVTRVTVPLEAMLAWAPPPPWTRA